MILGEPITAVEEVSSQYGEDDMVEWVKRAYGKGQIDRAAETLLPWWQSPPEVQWDKDVIADAFGIVENWRTCHAFPLNHFQNVLRSRAKKIQPRALIAQRLKRFSTLMNKLVREPSMKLSQMQDLGGCRAILSSVQEVDRLHQTYCGGQVLPGVHSPLKCYDYIRHPKEDGYRGVHVVGRYASRDERHAAWNGQRIEIQLRTRLQHAFATTVETVTTFTREPLKFGAGPEEWRRFFALMGSALASREGTPMVDDTPSDPKELVAELGDKSKALDVRRKLMGWARALRALPSQNIKQYRWLLLVLDLSKNTIQATGYFSRRKASEAVSKIERAKTPDLDAVLVWVYSFRTLRAAYPNYYADSEAFLEALDTALGKANTKSNQ